MRRIFVQGIACALFVTGITAGAALASNPHFIGAAPTVSCSATNGVYSCSSTGFEMAGLGNNSQPVTATLSVNQNYTAECQNNGGNVAPGQTTPGSTGKAGENGANSGSPGNYTFAPLGPTSSSAPPTPKTGKGGVCPNSGWSFIGWTPSTVYSYSLVVKQGNTVIYSQTGP